MAATASTRSPPSAPQRVREPLQAHADRMGGPPGSPIVLRRAATKPQLALATPRPSSTRSFSALRCDVLSIPRHDNRAASQHGHGLPRALAKSAPATAPAGDRSQTARRRSLLVRPGDRRALRRSAPDRGEEDLLCRMSLDLFPPARRHCIVLDTPHRADLSEVEAGPVLAGVGRVPGAISRRPGAEKFSPDTMSTVSPTTSRRATPATPRVRRAASPSGVPPATVARPPVRPAPPSRQRRPPGTGPANVRDDPLNTPLQTAGAAWYTPPSCGSSDFAQNVARQCTERRTFLRHAASPQFVFPRRLAVRPKPSSPV